MAKNQNAQLMFSKSYIANFTKIGLTIYDMHEITNSGLV
jgi:hypothetical protein